MGGQLSPLLLGGGGRDRHSTGRSGLTTGRPGSVLRGRDCRRVHVQSSGRRCKCFFELLSLARELLLPLHATNVVWRGNVCGTVWRTVV